MSPAPVHNFAGMKALVLHGSEDVRNSLSQRLASLGMRVDAREGELRAGSFDSDVLLIDIDCAYDEQLPWSAGHSELPTVGLIGSESPGRLAWALRQEIDAYLPLSALAKVFSALVIAHETFARKCVRREKEASHAKVQSGRLDVVRAVLLLMEETGDEALALKKLRALAMVERITVEEAARSVIAGPARLRRSES